MEEVYCVFEPTKRKQQKAEENYNFCTFHHHFGGQRMENFHVYVNIQQTYKNQMFKIHACWMGWTHKPLLILVAIQSTDGPCDITLLSNYCRKSGLSEGNIKTVIFSLHIYQSTLMHSFKLFIKIAIVKHVLYISLDD